MTDLNKKQAFWAEQLPLFKENYICLAQLDAVEFNNETGDFDALTKDATGFDLEDILEAYHSVNTGWAMWLRAKAQAVPEKKIYLTCEQLYAAANFGAPNKDPELLETELTIAWFDEAHSGSGYYVYISEYPEEGAMKLESESGAEG